MNRRVVWVNYVCERIVCVDRNCILADHELCGEKEMVTGNL